MNNNVVGTTKPLQKLSCIDGVIITFPDTATHKGNVWKMYLVFKAHLTFGPSLVTRPRRLRGYNED
jgi:hypothetical protein